ncbi:glycosyltransferase family 2 protein [Salinicola aestuarinus]|uniref:glycosyltransferase family 2 protein n=1 Tax=Salinicola aestuarinus TaxID=1949082 RepID=UPI000DA1EB41|nr:glycosyltransferase family 2 protein [Salinicola aestuarinus]
MIVIPMVGASSRFFKAGYDKPKYQLPLWGETVFYWVMRSFSRYFNQQPFLFILRDDYQAREFVQAEASRLGISDFSIVVLEAMTQGQADTVAQGLREVADEEPITIFNIDTLRYEFDLPDFVKDSDGYLEVFHGEGDHWSFVRPGDDFTVLQTTEKDRISDLCSNGLYHFASKKLFLSAFENAIDNDIKSKGEFYVAPLYNFLVQDGKDIRYLEVSLLNIDFCGTPEEYQALVDRGPVVD